MPQPLNSSTSSLSYLKNILASFPSDRLNLRTQLATIAARTTKPSPTNNVGQVLPSFTIKDLWSARYFPNSPNVVVPTVGEISRWWVCSLPLNNEPKILTFDFMDFIICLFE
ncbi:hypothetical protein L1987_48698 [Smallanthus sonchifolius]|uniref:Uncharacterized protein n=1 Tax=Smallanthus sonchifolius TaxID=185202 RepID=A0ACB9FSN3_9ASTR|nr:hypothetical protein L1987_48698 [Smallanthus sonchifolius]